MQDNTAASREPRAPTCPHPERHRADNPLFLRQDDNGIWRCERCGYAEVHNPDYVITNSNFRKKARNQKVTARSPAW
jgi:ribosomal protein L37AE/L43A